MQRLLGYFLLAIAAAMGTAYAGYFLDLIIGDSTVVMYEHDGTTRTLTSGPNTPRPDWVPTYPKARVSSATRWGAAKEWLDAGGVDVVTSAALPDIKRFYVEELERLGFTVKDEGLYTLNSLTAAYLGVACFITAKRESTGHEVSVQVRTPDGFLVRSRLVQLHWWVRRPGYQSPHAKLAAAVPEQRQACQDPA